MLPKPCSVMAENVFILGGARTPMTQYVGALKDVSAIDLGAVAARGALTRTAVQPEWVDHAEKLAAYAMVLRYAEGRRAGT